MNAQENKLVRFLEGHDKTFVIPVYQRNYDWKKDNCIRLIDDLKELAITNRKSHFFGSLVVIYNDDGEGQEYIIIDGQQRLTTISLLLLAIVKIIEKRESIKSELDYQLIMNEYLLGKYTNKEKMKLKPVKSDKQAFCDLFDNESSIHHSNITSNYKYFFNALSASQDREIINIYNSIKKLDIVEIKLKRGEDDPQLIFESLNSTGLNLTEADKVRNFILMNLDSSKQEYYYEKYWNIIESNTNFDVSSFLKDYITMKENYIPNKDKVYVCFKDLFIKVKSDLSIEELIVDLYKFSKYYHVILSANMPEKTEISKSLNKLNRLDMSVSYPFLLELFDDYSTKIITESDVIQVLSIIESFILRRFLCDVATNALNKIFMTLARDIKKHPEHNIKYVEIFKYIITQKKSSQRFPSDDELREKLLIKDVYNLKAKNKIFFLERLENYSSKEELDIQKLIDNSKITIEHIMPQTLTPSWKVYLGEKWETVYSKYIHTLGNITLTGYNSELSNRPYYEKLSMNEGLLKSKLFLNSMFSNYKDWNEESIITRAGSLIERTIEIWSFPKTEYSTKQKIENTYGLNEDTCFTGEKIESFTFWDQNYKVNTWIDFYKTIIGILYDLEPSKIFSLIDDLDFNKNCIISREERKLRKAAKITDEIYIEKNLSTDSIINYTKQFLNALGIDESEITIILTEKN